MKNEDIIKKVQARNFDLPCAGDMVNELVQNAVKTFCCNMEW